MSTSADRPPASERGFTLLEIMVCVAVVGLCILPLLEVREQSSRMAYKSGHMLRALSYGDKILSERMLDPDKAKDETGIIEEDPAFGYTLTVEDYDLSTGRVVEEQDDANAFSTSTSFSTTSQFTTGVPQDALPGPDDVAAADTQHRVRRVKISITWPALEGEEREELLLEGFLPRVITEKDKAAMAAAAAASAAPGAAK
ncbi:MAG TPA: prepilin-type N-terminal cleavage/methylation domain-containing protein [Planctomycetota bacterium]|nr:prepilin-type N-terminal cleavage/methylation domain-containing protein [Planctomycetota bacterium]